MWPFCSANPWLWSLLPLLLGLLTGWWAWRRVAGAEAVATYDAPRVDPVPAAKPEPVAAPVKAPEPVKAAEPVAKAPEPAPVVKAAPVAAAVALTAIGIPAAVGAADDLLQIKGIGPKLNDLLISLGVTRFDQIAAWGAAEIDKVDDHLGSFKNRISRDSWVEQAGLLATGKIAEFEAKFGKLDSENQ
jgi:predicted flap endonuclease-1-like 5' DNA nuclease